MGGSRDEDERALRALMERWFAATARRDIDAVMEGIAPDVVSYEHDAPLVHVGADAVRAVCQGGFDASEGPIGWDVPEPTLIVQGDLAVQWGLNRMTYRDATGAEAVSWSRGTRVFQRRDGRWEMIHQHVSYPYDPETGEAKTDLAP